MPKRLHSLVVTNAWLPLNPRGGPRQNQPGSTAKITPHTLFFFAFLCFVLGVVASSTGDLQIVNTATSLPALRYWAQMALIADKRVKCARNRVMFCQGY